MSKTPDATIAAAFDKFFDAITSKYGPEALNEYGIALDSFDMPMLTSWVQQRYSPEIIKIWENAVSTIS